MIIRTARARRRARGRAITALRLAGSTNIAAALRHHARNVLRPLATYKIT